MRGHEPYRDWASLHKPQRLKVIRSSDSSSDAVPAGCALTVQAPRLIGGSLSCRPDSLGECRLRGAVPKDGCAKEVSTCKRFRSDAQFRGFWSRPTRRSRNTKTLHLVKQRGALHTESGGRPFRTTEPPLRGFAGCDNFPTYLFLEGRVDDL